MTVLCENGQLRVILSEAETVKYNIDCVFFESGPAADNALEGLLRIASQKSGFKSRATRFVIEIYPVFDGGCEIFFIPENEERQGRRQITARRAAPTIFEFDDADGLLAAVELLYSDETTRNVRSSLYEYRGRYRLAVFGDLGRRRLTLAGDFADRVLPSSRRAQTVEYGRELCRDNAVETIGEALWRRPKFPR